jgi:nucleotidyltransferase/DNA polymerase involved in DNA repair
MLACVAISAFPLRAALRLRPELADRPAALAPRPGEADAIGPCTVAAERAGVRPGMRLGEALATCPGLALVEQDPAAAEEEWERLLRRLEDAGFSVEPAGPGCAYFETRGIERLAGGLDETLRRALAAVGPGWGARVGAATRRFAALAAASVAQEGSVLVVDDCERALFLEPLPLDLLPLTPDRRAELSNLGIRRLGELARLPGASVVDRLGLDGELAWQLSRGEGPHRVLPRTPPEEIAESLAFPDSIANVHTLERALVVIVERLLARPERRGRMPRQVTVTARLVGGGSWRHVTTLREPTAEPARLHAALAPKLGDLPGPVAELRLALGALAEPPGAQEELIRPRGSRLRELLRDGLRQARAAAGVDAVCTVVEVAPWSRIPEARAMLVPHDD